MIRDTEDIYIKVIVEYLRNMDGLFFSYRRDFIINYYSMNNIYALQINPVNGSLYYIILNVNLR